MSIEFTQYVLPDGHRRLVAISLPDAVEDKARRIIAAGYRFEIEILSTGLVSATITDDEDGDIDIVLTTNDETVPARITDMVNRFDVDRTKAEATD